jgi:hypothetical protein
MKALNLKTFGMHLFWTIAIATPLRSSIPAEMGAGLVLLLNDEVRFANFVFMFERVSG